MPNATTENKSTSYSIRPATLEDVSAIVPQRRGMLEELRNGDMSLLETTLVAFEQWMIPRMKSGEYLGWMALSPDGQVVAGIGLWLQEWPPSLRSRSVLRGYILNVSTNPAHRKQGLARQLTQTALDYCRSKGIELVALHASQFGKPLYESLGFEPTTEMRIYMQNDA
jgi:ribosomal protein S18 acetylase RimI-like enzyme